MDKRWKSAAACGILITLTISGCGAAAKPSGNSAVTHTSNTTTAAQGNQTAAASTVGTSNEASAGTTTGNSSSVNGAANEAGAANGSTNGSTNTTSSSSGNTASGTSGSSQSTGANITQHIHAVMQTGVQNNELNTVKFLNQQTGWVGAKGEILYTGDGGQHFNVQYRGDVNVQGLDVVSGSDVVAWGVVHLPGQSQTQGEQSAGALLVTHDGGKKWDSVRVPTATSSGGSASTTQATSQPALFVEDVDFVTSSIGYLVAGTATSGTGQLFKTSDGGNHWSAMQTPAKVNTIGFADGADGWIYTTDGKVYRTTDSGKTWTQTLSGLPGDIGGGLIQVTSSTSAWFLLIGQAGMSQQSYSVFRTTNGTSWHPVLGISTAGAGPAPGGATKAPAGPGSSPGPLAVVNGTTAVMAGTCRACGYGTTVIATTNDGGQTWHQSGPIQGANGLPGIQGMSFPSEKDGWLVDGPFDAGTLLHTEDGGKSWHEVLPSRSPYPLQGVSFVTPNTGYGLGVPGDINAVLKTTDGGQTWTFVGDLPVRQSTEYMDQYSFATISFPTALIGYAVGSDGKVYQTKDGGQSWSLMSLAYGQHGYDGVYFVSNTTGLALSTFDPKKNVITTDGGKHWTSVIGNTSAEAILGVANPQVKPTLQTMVTAESARWAGVRGDMAWVPAQNGRGFYTTTDNGQHWTNYDFGQRAWYDVVTMQFVNHQDGWLLLSDGILMRTQNGGKLWTPLD